MLIDTKIIINDLWVKKGCEVKSSLLSFPISLPNPAMRRAQLKNTLYGILLLLSHPGNAYSGMHNKNYEPVPTANALILKTQTRPPVTVWPRLRLRRFG